MFVFTLAEGDLYVTIADTLQSNLYIQTWRSEPGKTFMTKNNHKLYNIVEVETAAGSWKKGCDHSKWCVSDIQNWMCVGDSNREPSQSERPGGALCINSKPVADAFRQIGTVSDTDSDCDTIRVSSSKRKRVGILS